MPQKTRMIRKRISKAKALAIGGKCNSSSNGSITCDTNIQARDVSFGISKTATCFTRLEKECERKGSQSAPLVEPEDR
jgi:hypothetical protein